MARQASAVLPDGQRLEDCTLLRFPHDACVGECDVFAATAIALERRAACLNNAAHGGTIAVKKRARRRGMKIGKEALMVHLANKPGATAAAAPAPRGRAPVVMIYKVMGKMFAIVGLGMTEHVIVNAIRIWCRF